MNKKDIEKKIQNIIDENNQLVVEIQSIEERLTQLRNHQQQLVGRATQLQELRQELEAEEANINGKAPVEAQDIKDAVASKSTRK